MLAEQIEESRDAETLKGYGIDDLDLDTLNTYRRLYSNREPDHPWNQIDMQDFLYNIGAWGRDRETGYRGVNRAGLLMFGRLRAIKEKFPNYMLDYQERPEAKTEARWVDRLTLDGTWSGNVFDFYRQVIRKLTVDLKVPFLLEGDQRQDDTSVHKALREALVNSLVHADYTGRASVLVVKRPDMFGFRNPGFMRIPKDIAINGGESDCRNRNLQDMFRYVGLGENAGSGLPKIYQGWDSQHWRKPALSEKSQPSEQTLLELQMMSLIPEAALSALRRSIGDKVFDKLSENERLILVTAHIETTVDHGRMLSMMDIHPRDLTVVFARLVEKELICQEGTGRGTVYFLASARLHDEFTEVIDSIGKLDGDQEHHSEALGVSSGGLWASSGGLGLDTDVLVALKCLAEPVYSTKRVSKKIVEDTILALCANQALSLDQLAQLLNRSTDVVRKDYLQPMLKNRQLEYKFPTIPNHPQQPYSKAAQPQEEQPQEEQPE